MAQLDLSNGKYGKSDAHLAGNGLFDRGAVYVHAGVFDELLVFKPAGSGKTHHILVRRNLAPGADAMAADAGISKAAAKKGLESFLGSVSGTLKKGGRVSLVGFGSWSVSRRAARDGRNPQTGATIKIAAKNVVKFKAGAELSGSVN